jgi:SAM-dependent methyltransferase
MDLSERKGAPARRHPWETARVAAIRRIVAGLRLSEPRVLDVGCGDGYLVRQLHAALRFRHVIAQDIHLTDALARELRTPGVEFVRELGEIEYQAELILLLDVLEHVPEPRALLLELASKRLAPDGRFVIAVPAFQQLFTAHDRALKHFRRYTREELVQLVESAELEVIDSGYLFSSLLVPRALTALRERRGRVTNGMSPGGGADHGRVDHSGVDPAGDDPGNSDGSAHGIGGWRGSALVTQLIHGALALDNALCLAARRRGVTVPGLTVWLTCKTR